MSSAVGRLIERIDGWLGVCERVFFVLANGCLIVMMVANIINIASRALLDKGIIFVYPWTIVLFTWMTFLGFFVIYRRHKDITVDFVVDYLGGTAKVVSRFLVDFIVIALMVVMLWHAPSIISKQVGVIAMVGIQRYWLSVPLFASCALILINFLIDLAHAWRGDPEPKHQPSSGI